MNSQPLYIREIDSIGSTFELLAHGSRGSGKVQNSRPRAITSYCSHITTCELYKVFLAWFMYVYAQM